jgi:hypothetical protein
VGAFPAVPGLSWTERIPDSRTPAILRASRSEERLLFHFTRHFRYKPHSGVLDVIRSAGDSLSRDAAGPDQQPASFDIIFTNEQILDTTPCHPRRLGLASTTSVQSSNRSPPSHILLLSSLLLTVVRVLCLTTSPPSKLSPRLQIMRHLPIDSPILQCPQSPGA